MWIYGIGRAFLERLPSDADLCDAIRNAFLAADIKTGTFTAVGAVKRAVIGYYDQTARCYVNKEIVQPAEILCCTGNVTEKDGALFVHAHITLSLEDGKAFGGHLSEGTVIFACELSGIEFLGEQARRAFDSATGLNLWEP
jgi:predicted DNA-binding protein with PD1-like motif